MILNHVAQTSTLLVVASARADAHFLRHRDLHAVDKIAIPQRLKNGIGETLDEQVLHRLFTQIMIDPVNLVLREHRTDRGV